MVALSFLAAFEYEGKLSRLSRVDPRPKLIWLVAAMVLSIAYSSLKAQLLIAVIMVLPVIALGGVASVVLSLLKSTSLLFAMVFGLNYVFTRDLSFSLAMGLRLVILVVCFASFFRSTHTSELSDLMTKLRIPFYVTFTFTTAIRFIPTLAMEAQEIMDAQASRGLELERGSLLRRLKNYIPLLVPILVCAIRRSYQLAEALESRCFGYTKKRTMAYGLPPMSKTDWMFLAASVAQSAAVILLASM
ncbi:MAG: hypothetical protein DRN96_00545 [Thermoproteota archaeon]|nr:MAG: hypothetical protein DRN96_00545 [Candidatus Korarchaeota archaeon]RLG53919.1 MAG: hypothetical protein DRN99_06025 [Candidatus Korarchaeota archaeon]